jgi:hypothetical protein
MKEEEYEEMNQRCRNKIVDLLGLIVGMRTYFEVKSPEIRFIHLQRKAFATIYYFYKHKFISPKALGSLFKSKNIIADISRHVFQSYKFGEQVRSKLLPLSSKNILKYWYYFPFKDMLDGRQSITYSFMILVLANFVLNYTVNP